LDIKTSWGLKPVKEKFSLAEKVDVPLYKQPSAYNNYKAQKSVDMKGILHTDKALINESDYTQAGD
jgi:hypothetical protein